jgi:hypothetical protein
MASRKNHRAPHPAAGGERAAGGGRVRAPTSQQVCAALTRTA